MAALFRKVARSRTSSLDESRLVRAINPDRIPRHVAIVMDGNGRWARQRGLPRTAGHRAGMESLRQVVKACSKLGVLVLTVYAFSTENWSRPKDEVSFLMGLFEEFLRREIDELRGEGVRVQFIGRVDGMPESARAAMHGARDTTYDNAGLILNIAMNYGGRAEIVDAARKIAAQAARGELAPEDIDEELFTSCLYTAGLPDPDLVIRTGREHRLSNFLLWQLAYSELVVTPVLWPDFGKPHLLHSIVEYQCRERRFGRV